MVRLPWLVDSTAQAHMQGSAELHTTSFTVPVLPTLLEYIPRVPKNTALEAEEKN